MDIFVFDTYALIEIIKGNKNYIPYLSKRIIINNFIFSEICYILFREKYSNAEKYLQEYSKRIYSIKPIIIKEAMEFRLKNKNFSMTDCISYFMAKDMNIRFLTSDKQFEGLENVEFVK